MLHGLVGLQEGGGPGSYLSNDLPRLMHHHVLSNRPAIAEFSARRADLCRACDICWSIHAAISISSIDSALLLPQDVFPPRACRLKSAETEMADFESGTRLRMSCSARSGRHARFSSGAQCGALTIHAAGASGLCKLLCSILHAIRSQVPNLCWRCRPLW